MARGVSVALPVLDGARYLDEVLGAVRGQQVDAEVEIVVVDSGSTDGSLEIARHHGALVTEIPKCEFSHGATRNRLMELASGDHVAFLTQDATPAHPGWLAALLAGFEAAEDVAAVFGPHEPRPGATHPIRAEMERHFAIWGEDVHVQRLDSSPAGLAAYRANPGALTFLSSVNLCLARWAWERVPFRAVPYAEDQLLGRELIEAGLAKAFHPRAVVLHSHDFPPVDFGRRYFDEWRSLREVLGHVQPGDPRSMVNDVRGLVSADRRWLRQRGVSGATLAGALAFSARHHATRVTASVVGSRADRLPAPLRRRLSLDGRDSFAPVELPASALATSGRVEVRGDWDWEWVRRAYPLGPLATEPHAGRADGPMTLAWLVPIWRVGSGGHTTIFRLIAELEARGHASSIFVWDPFERDRRPAHALREEISTRFVPLRAPVFKSLDSWPASVDVAVATNWWTAWPLRDLPGAREKAYLVQDHEPEFEATSAPRLWAEETYRMGYRHLAYTKWMADLLEERYGAPARFFDCGTDLATYAFGGEAEREPGLVAVYARQETERRAVELALAGVATLVERRRGVRVVLFGANGKLTSPVPCENLGVQPPAALAALYRRASAGVVLSLTTHSLVAQEMMAAGLPVVELDGANVTSELGGSGERALLVPPRPDALADALGRLLDDRELAAGLAGRARAWVEERTWERAGGQAEAAFRSFLASPTRRSSS